MNRKEFNAFCQSLPQTTHVVQWGNADVWKIGGKIFAIGSHWGEDKPEMEVKISFKCSDFSYDLLREQDGIIPAPYLARAKWVQVEEPNALSDEELGRYIMAAYNIISQKLTRKIREEQGIVPLEI